MKNTHTQYKFILLPGLDGTGYAYTWLKSKMLQSNIQEDNIHVVSYKNEFSYQKLFDNIKGFIINSTLPVVLIAESFAGPLALHLASEYPDKVKKVVLSGSFGVKPVCTFIPSIGLQLFKCFPVSLIPMNKLPYKLVHDVLLNNYGNDDIKYVMEDIYNVGEQKIFDKRINEVVSLPSKWDDQWIKNIDNETLIFKPLHDRLIHKSNSDVLHKNLINSILIEMQAPHLLFQTQAKTAWNHIMEFINK